MDFDLNKTQWVIVTWVLGIFLALVIGGGIKIVDLFNVVVILVVATLCILTFTNKRIFIRSQIPTPPEDTFPQDSKE